MKLLFSLLVPLLYAGIVLLAPTPSTLFAEIAESERVDDLPAITIIASQDATQFGFSELEYTSSTPPSDHSWHRTLMQMPGILAQESFGGFDPPRLSIRGSGIQSAPVSRGLVMNLNGFPLNFADGSFNLTLLDGRWMKEVALTPGPASGAFALGGTLSLNTLANWQHETSSVEGVYGSHESRSAMAQIRVDHPNAHWVVEASLARLDGWRSHASQKRESLLLAGQLKLTPDSQLVIQVFGSRPRYLIPGPLSLHDALHSPETILQRVLLDRPRRDTQYLQFGAKLISRGSNFNSTAGFAIATHQDDFYQLLPNGISDSRGVESSFFAHLWKDWNSQMEHTTRVHLLVQQGWNRIQRYSTILGARGVRMGDNDLRPLSATLSANHRIAFTKHHAIEAGVSFLSARREINERFNGRPSTGGTDSNGEIAPRLAWSWRLDSQHTISFSWARSFEAPTNNDLLFTTFHPPPPVPVLRRSNLDWQRSDTFEIRVQGTSGRGSWSAAFYHARWDGELLRLQAEDGSSRGTVNADRTTHMGWEAFWELRLVQHPNIQLSAWTTVQMNAIRFDQNPIYGTSDLAGIPRYHGAAGLSATTNNGWSITPACAWQAGKTYADHANTLASPGYAVWSLDVGYAHPSGWGLNLRVNNVLDHSYVASSAGVLDKASGPNQAIFLPGTGRRMEARLQYTW